MKRIKTPLLMLLSATLLFSCVKSDNGEGEVVQPRVLAVHASPDAPAVDIRVNNQVAASGLAFTQSTGYLPVQPGTNNVQVSPAGGSTPVLTTDLNLTAGRNYSIFAVDSLSRLKAVAVEDNLTPPAAGKAHVRFFHFSPDAPAVDIAVAGGPVLFSNRSFNDQAAGGAAAFTPVDAGTYSLEVRAAGTTDVVLPLSNITFEQGKIYTVYASGSVAGSGAQGLGAQIITNQ